jgi:hypothetical protein
LARASAGRRRRDPAPRRWRGITPGRGVGRAPDSEPWQGPATLPTGTGSDTPRWALYPLFLSTCPGGTRTSPGGPGPRSGTPHSVAIDTPPTFNVGGKQWRPKSNASGGGGGGPGGGGAKAPCPLPLRHDFFLFEVVDGERRPLFAAEDL